MDDSDHFLSPPRIQSEVDHDSEEQPTGNEATDPDYSWVSPNAPEAEDKPNYTGEFIGAD